jgi:hypothetical protein
MKKRHSLSPLDTNILCAPVADELEAPKRRRVKKGESELAIASFVETYYDGDPAVMALCKAAKKYDPPVIFAWINVHTFVESIPHVHLPPPFALPQNPSVAQFKTALLNYVRMPGS